MKKISVLFVFIALFFFSASAKNKSEKKNNVPPAKAAITKNKQQKAKHLVIGNKNAPVKAESEKKVFDSSCGVIFYCNGGFVHLDVTIIGDTQPGECQAIRDAIEQLIRDVLDCGAGSNY